MADEPRWPDAFVVGAQKAATTSLYHYLDQHPDVWMAPRKEPHFFSDYRTRTWRDGAPDPEALEAYLDLFRDAPDVPVVGEASASYLCDPAAPGRIAARVPDAAIVVSLRDPVERAHSHYLMNRGNPGHQRPLLDILEEVQGEANHEVDDWAFLREGFYAEPLERYLDAFGSDRVHVLLVADLQADPEGTLRDLARFLDVDPDPMADVDFDLRFNPYGEARNRLAGRLRKSLAVRDLARRVVPLRLRRWVDNHLLLETEEKPQLEPEARAILEEIYREEVQRVEEVLGRDLPQLRASWGGEDQPL